MAGIWPVTDNKLNTPPVVFLWKYDEQTTVAEALHSVDISALGRSRPAADASREVEERWLLDGLEISFGSQGLSLAHLKSRS